MVNFGKRSAFLYYQFYGQQKGNRKVEHIHFILKKSNKTL
jgi:hypothetical protein